MLVHCPNYMDLMFWAITSWASSVFVLVHTAYIWFASTFIFFLYSPHSLSMWNSDCKYYIFYHLIFQCTVLMTCGSLLADAYSLFIVVMCQIEKFLMGYLSLCQLEIVWLLLEQVAVVSFFMSPNTIESILICTPCFI